MTKFNGLYLKIGLRSVLLLLSKAHVLTCWLRALKAPVVQQNYAARTTPRNCAWKCMHPTQQPTMCLVTSSDKSPRDSHESTVHPLDEQILGKVYLFFSWSDSFHSSQKIPIEWRFDMIVAEHIRLAATSGVQSLAWNTRLITTLNHCDALDSSLTSSDRKSNRKLRLERKPFTWPFMWWDHRQSWNW